MTAGEQAPDEEPVEQAGPLPDAVRARVVALAAEAVGRIAPDSLPASLKKVASFAPPRRARLAGNQIAAVLETDEAFREHVAVQVRALHGALVDALESGTSPAAADPVEVAAAAYLVRTPGWAALVAAAADAAEAVQATAIGKQADQQVSRLQKQLSDALAEAEEHRAKLRDQVTQMKAENADLRRKLGDTRAQLKSAEETAASATESAAAASRSGGAGRRRCGSRGASAQGAHRAAREGHRRRTSHRAGRA